jgi:hypothetical protein
MRCLWNLITNLCFIKMKIVLFVYILGFQPALSFNCLSYLCHTEVWWENSNQNLMHLQISTSCLNTCFWFVLSTFSMPVFMPCLVQCWYVIIGFGIFFRLCFAFPTARFVGKLFRSHWRWSVYIIKSLQMIQMFVLGNFLIELLFLFFLITTDIQ